MGGKAQSGMTIQEILEKQRGNASALTVPVITEEVGETVDDDTGEVLGGTDFVRAAGAPLAITVRVSAIVKTVLMDITMEGIAPDRVGDYLRAIDQGAQWQTEFPKRGGFGGSRETKSGTVLSIVVKGGKFPGISMTLTDDAGEGVSVDVGKNKRDAWPEDFAKLGVGSPEKVELFRGLLGGKDGNATWLPNGKRIAVKYSIYEGKGYYESMEVAA